MTYYVHFGGNGFRPYLTLSFKSRLAAVRAVNASHRSGWPARLQVVVS